ncbi:hypothetical protein MMC28_003225 [Mycoblastus sanguinarius]|nr:hypothetical protein [Mycoblastus sanguinarius]
MSGSSPLEGKSRQHRDVSLSPRPNTRDLPSGGERLPSMQEMFSDVPNPSNRRELSQLRSPLRGDPEGPDCSLPVPHVSPPPVSRRPQLQPPQAQNGFSDAARNSRQAEDRDSRSNSYDAPSGYRLPIHSGPPHDLRSGPAHDLRSGPSYDLRSGPPHDLRLCPSHDLRSAPSHDLRSGPLYDPASTPVSPYAQHSTETRRGYPTPTAHTSRARTPDEQRNRGRNSEPQSLPPPPIPYQNGANGYPPPYDPHRNGSMPHEGAQYGNTGFTDHRNGAAAYTSAGASYGASYGLVSNGYAMAAPSHGHAFYPSHPGPLYQNGYPHPAQFEVEGSGQQSKKRRGNLPRDTTDMLKAWFHDHIAHPYPTEEEKQILCSRTGLAMTQISNWFINARRRRGPELTAQAAAEVSLRDASRGNSRTSTDSSDSDVTPRRTR